MHAKNLLSQYNAALYGTHDDGCALHPYTEREVACMEHALQACATGHSVVLCSTCSGRGVVGVCEDDNTDAYPFFTLSPRRYSTQQCHACEGSGRVHEVIVKYYRPFEPEKEQSL